MSRFNKKRNTEGGYNVLELLIAIAVFTIGISGIIILTIDNLNTADKTQTLSQSVLVASEGIEAVRSIRDRDFENLILPEDGSVHGLSLNESVGEWSFSNTSDTVDHQSPDGTSYGKVYVREILIDEVGDDDSATTSIKKVESRVSWDDHTATTSLITYITNWYRD